MKGSKWAWIRDKCIEKEYQESAKLAQEIESGLLTAYGRSETEDWKASEEWEIEGLFKDSPFYLFGTRLLCRGCVESHNDCNVCLFARYCGKCAAPDSSFTRFDAAFEKENGNE